MLTVSSPMLGCKLFDIRSVLLLYTRVKQLVQSIVNSSVKFTLQCTHQQRRIFNIELIQQLILSLGFIKVHLDQNFNLDSKTFASINFIQIFIQIVTISKIIQLTCLLYTKFFNCGNRRYISLQKKMK